MPVKQKVTVEKRKRRIPVPQKPPKTEEGKNAYNRRKEKEKTRKQISEKQ